MTNRIRAREWEALSSYLDNQLSPKERSRLDSRLKGDVELRQALEELRRTRIILRSQRPLRAPHNFTLTPAMAGARRGRSGYNPGSFTVLRLASVLATIFFILISVGDLVVQNYGPQPRKVSQAEQPAPVFGMGGGGGGGPGIMPLAPTAAPGELQVGIESANSAAYPPVGPQGFAVTVTPLGTNPVTAEAMKQAEQPPPALAQPGANPADQSRQAGPEAAQPAARPLGATLVIRLLQLLLIVLAIGAGLAAYYVRRTTG